MKKFTFLFFSLLLTFTAKADKLLVSTSEDTPEHVYTIKNENGIVVGSNTVDVGTNNGVSFGEFAFFAAEGDGNYYIYSITEKKWLDYTKADSYNNTKNFVSLSDTKNNYFKIEESNNKAGAAGRYQIRPYNNTGVAGKYLNYYQGADGSSKLGIWQESASVDNGSCYVFLYNDVEISDINKLNNNIVYTLVSSRGWLMYNQNNSSVVASTASYKNITTNAEASHFQWAVYKSKNNKYYLFNIAARCFIGNNSDEAGRFPFLQDPDCDIKIVESTKNGYPFVFSTDNYGAINHFNHTGEPGVANWKGNDSQGGLRSLNDDGSCHKLTAVSTIDEALLATIESNVDYYESHEDLVKEQRSLKLYLDEVKAYYKDGNNWRISTELNAYSQAEGDEDLATAFDEAYEYTTIRTTVEEVSAQRTRIERLVNNLTINQPETGKYYTLRCVNGMRRLSSVVSENRYEMSTEGTGTINTTFLLEANGENKTLLAYGTGLYISTGANRDETNINAAHPKIEFLASDTKKGEYNITVNSTNSTRYIYGALGHKNNHLDSGTGDPETDSGYSWWIEEVNSLPVTISAAKYASFYAPVAVTIPEGVTAYYLTEEGISENSVDMTPIEAGETIPANTGVILYGEAGTYNFRIGGEATADVRGNLFAGTVAKTNVADDAYILGVKEGTVGLYKVEGADTNGFTNGSHKAYLPSSPATAALSAGFSFDFEGTTAIEEVATENSDNIYYDLSGRRVENPTRGIYIVNGRKVMVK